MSLSTVLNMFAVLTTLSRYYIGRYMWASKKMQFGQKDAIWAIIQLATTYTARSTTLTALLGLQTC